MNNAKVRIYDLSKELNLDNKDILEICQQLNISVKSHSSTITEDQAERIKARAEKYGTSPPPKPVKGERKQQILAIHHKQTRVGAAEERPSVKPAPSLLAAPPRPPESVKSQAPTAIAAGEGRAPAAPSREATPPPAPEETSLPPEAIELLQPPARASQKRPAAGEVSSELARKPGPELKRPQAPKPAREAAPALEGPPPPGEPATAEEGGLLESESREKPQLKRPAPPRAPRETWEEEEEEEKIAQGKVKAPGKGKRRPPKAVDEEEEEFEPALEASGTGPSVSLSTARPPKPKSLEKTRVAASTQKPKRTPVRVESGAARVRGERRERQPESQRPDRITLTGSLTVRELAECLQVPETEIIKSLFFKGLAVQITQTLDLDMARTVAQEMGVTVETAEETAAAAKTEMVGLEDLENLQLRPPVVTIMGHVDHGKTTLLDSIRQTKVAQGEAGGITQHIGAYHVDLEQEGKPQQIVFLDTPGHEAFTAMRARGARVTDIAVLVVAADDGVQPQTREAISHARAAGVPIVVAINKIDKLEANPDRIKQELADLGLVPEEWGGETIMVPVSALKGENLDTLLEMILLVSEVAELSANPDRLAKGTVIEAHLDRTRGPVATLLVQNGTLQVGDVLVAGSVFAKIRAMIDDRGDKVEAASPSFAVEVLGLSDVPDAGEEFEVFEQEKEARAVAEARLQERHQSRLQQAMAARRVTLSTLSAQAQEGELKELNLILKADVQGSVEAILGALQQLPQREVQIRVLLAGAGEVTETDVDLAAASGAVVVGFNTTLASGARQAADREGVDIREYDVIYRLLEDIQGAMEGLLEPEEVESPLGQAEVRAVFPVGRGTVAGCYVQSGKVVRNRSLRVRRGGEVVYEGNLDSLKRLKEDAREVNAGYECGIGTHKFNDWKEGDIIEVYEMVMKRRTLST